MSAVTIEKSPFGALADGRQANLFTLSNDRLRVAVTDFGARLVSIETPDRRGDWGHVLLGFDNVDAYDKAGGSFGAFLGRYANRIAGGRFSIDGKTYQLATNENGNTLHGGPVGFASTFWDAEIAAEKLILTHVSPDGDQGFPGSLTTRAEYFLAGDRLQIELSATTDKPTIINLSSHPYFNLGGFTDHDIFGHQLRINAARFLPTDHAQIPTGDLAAVAGTPFDFRIPKPFGDAIRDAHPQLLIARGYDHCFALNDGDDAAATVHDPASGRTLTLFTNQPGLQVYSGNSLDGSIVGRHGKTFRQSSAFALEAQNFPDAPNHPNFPNAVLRPGETYAHMIAYLFTTENQ
jgi:aldose 1-epimerase